MFMKIKKTGEVKTFLETNTLWRVGRVLADSTLTDALKTFFIFGKTVCWCESVPAGSLPDHNRVITDGQTHCVFGRVSLEDKLVWMSGRWTCQSVLADLKRSSKDRDVLPSMLLSVGTCNVLWNTLSTAVFHSYF